MNKLEEVGKIIKSKREELNITQEELAEKISISVEYLNQIETNEVDVDFETFLKICDELKLKFLVGDTKIAG